MMEDPGKDNKRKVLIAKNNFVLDISREKF